MPVIPPTPWWMTWTRTSGCCDLRELGHDRLDGADHVALDDEVQVLHLALLHLREERLERDAALRALRELLCAHPGRALAGDAAGDTLALDDAPVLAGRRRLVEAEHLDRIARAGLLDLLAAIVVERPHLAPRVAGDDGVADAERAAVDEHRRDRPAADVEPGLDDRPGRLSVRVRAQPLELEVGDEEHLLEELVEAGLLLRRDGGELRRRRPSPRAGGPRSASSALTLSWFASGRSILFTATTIGTSAARAWEMDSLVCGITPSSAATTRTATSVTFAPRARMAVNASWPGVSRKVIFRPSWSTW